ncbi:HSF-type DNA-binding-domain-containing protein [Choanephora cucurbitarum]|nr:HSF-type DNA-binding-domain-containing protein [Choanephora cucurbitarum]
MVDDESTRDLITWTGSGDQFTVFNNTEFSRVVLPRYFKHCNWSSFVRQLNMYDFHKVNDNNEDDTSDKDNFHNQVQRWDFKHPWFNKAGIDCLHKIRRKPPRNRLIPQMRYSNAMEILPSNSPDNGHRERVHSTSPLVEMPRATTDLPNLSSDNSYYHSLPAIMPMPTQMQPKPSMDETVRHLSNHIGSMEQKLDHTSKEVDYLKKTVAIQQEVRKTFLKKNMKKGQGLLMVYLKQMLEELMSTINQLKSARPQNTSDPVNEFNQYYSTAQPARKPRKIHELLGSGVEPQQNMHMNNEVQLKRKRTTKAEK